MVDCAECSESQIFPYTCSHCHAKFCSEHFLPEKHECPGLRSTGSTERWFESPDDEGVTNRGHRGKPTPDTRLWECTECGRRHPYNPSNCVRCDGRVLRPVEVSEDEKLSHHTNRREKELRRRRRRREAGSESDELANHDSRVERTSLWRLQAGLADRIYSVFGLLRTERATEVDDAVFIHAPTEVDTFYRLSRDLPSDGRPEYTLLRYERGSVDGNRVALHERGTQAHSEQQIEDRFPRGLVHCTDVEWDEAIGVMRKLS